jgi:uncharacterized protein YciI
VSRKTCSDRRRALADHGVLSHALSLSLSPYKNKNARRQPSQSSAAASEPKHLLLNYSYVPDILEKRGPYREAHLAGAQKKLDEGKLVCAGAVGLPPRGATFFFKGASRAEVEAFVKDDAYVQNGLVTAWSIEPYTVVVGDP